MISYTGYLTQFGQLTKNTSTANQTTGTTLINNALRHLTHEFYFNERQYTTTTVANQQFYYAPPQLEQLINVTVTIGSIVWTPKTCPSREYWDALNAVPFYNDFPQFYFLYFGNQVGIWPTPASSSNTITMNYKVRITDLSQADYVTGTVTVTQNSPTITSSGATFVAGMADRWIQVAGPTGDNKWYQILSVNTGTNTLTLYNNYTGASGSTLAYTIGEMPLVAETYQDVALYRALWIYYTSIVPNANMSRLYKDLYDNGYGELTKEFGQKTTSPVLTDTDAPIYNPNLFQTNIAQI